MAFIDVQYRYEAGDGTIMYHCVHPDGRSTDAKHSVLLPWVYNAPAGQINVKTNEAGALVMLDGSAIPRRHAGAAKANGLAAVAPVPEKERLIVQELRDFIDNDDSYTVALVAGIRKVGKTTALRQLAASCEGSVFIDCTHSGKDYATIRNALSDETTRLLLLDEFARLDEFDQIAQYVYDMTAQNGRVVKVVMTGSSAAHIIKLRDSKLGGGRARLFRMPPVMFIEYLYLTGKIMSYKDYSGVRNEHFGEYLSLDGLPPTLRIQFDRQYFSDFYRDVQSSNEVSCLTSSLIDLEHGDLQAMADMIAYKLSEPRRYHKVMAPEVGGQEFRNIQLTRSDFDGRGIDLSDAFVSISKDRAARPIPATDRGRILSFMLWAGLANMELTKHDDISKLLPAHKMLGMLRNAKTENDLVAAFKMASICLMSPLFYSRLGKDIYEKAGVDANELFRGGRILGLMFELYARGAVGLRSEEVMMSAIKLSFAGLGDVDVYDERNGLLFEASIHNKEDEDVNVQKYFEGEGMIRVCASWDKDGIYNGVRHIPYAKLCCMLDNGDIYMLPRS